VPAIDDLKALQTMLIEEIVFSSQVSRFETELNDVTGATQTRPVVRIGTFNAVSADGYLHMNEGESTLSVLPRQPARHYASSAKDFFHATGGNASVAIDPSRGSLLSLVIQSPGIVRQMTYGGAIGYTIITIGLVGFVIAAWRLWSLNGTRRRVASQLKAESADPANPLGRVLAVAEENRLAPVETLERKLDEAVMRETPSLERYQGIIKVIAGVAPLMGLLGTVVGMIRTFQTITLFGSGDPRLMADGISQALVTTVEGLVVAIPLVFMHALMTDRSREVIDILEEQSAGLVARHTEREG
jgi:biopolymer transport protein ExbB